MPFAKYTTGECVKAELVTLCTEVRRLGRVAPVLDRLDAAKIVALAKLQARDQGHA